MDLYTSLSTLHPGHGTALTIGMFDGVHLGHRSILDRLTATARAKNLDSVLITLWPHPRKVFSPQTPLSLLTLLPQKLELLQTTGVEKVLLQEFNPEFYNLSGEEFVRDYLVKQLKMRYILIGHDHTFGKEKTGNLALLKSLSSELNFEVDQLDAVEVGGQNISSTLIRQQLLDGKVEEANRMLGYSYHFKAKVVRGDQIGRTLGFPTANLQPEADQLVPAHGAYAVQVKVGSRLWPAMLNIGMRPTVSGTRLQIETHLIGADLDLYDKEVEVSFEHFLRREQKFRGIEELKAQLTLDRQRTLQLLS